MKILHIIPSLSPEHGGPSESVWRLARGLHDMRLAEVDLWATDIDTSLKFIDNCKNQLSNIVFFKGHRSPLGSFSLAFAGELRAKARQYDLVHIHSVFNYITLVAASICLNREVPYVISPRGMFQPWSLRQKGLEKKIFRRVFLDRHVRKAGGVHLTSDFEKESFLLEYPGANAVSIPNPLPVVHSSDISFLEHFPELRGRKILLYLSRIHPKKGVEELLEAWHRVADEFPAWHLALVGPGRHADIKKMQKSISRLNLHERVSWLGPLFDGDRDETYKAAELFIQPSYQENFGNSIAEAMAAGLPVITTQATPWKILQERQWGWWVPMNVESLAKVLRQSLSLSSEELKKMGQAAKTWIESECSVETVARQMSQWYQRVLK